MEIKDDFGNTFQPVVKKEATEKVVQKPKEETSAEDVPF